ncbi:hypothetical protein BDV27DRAFT_158743 [Aspergillus caelatus]|uniref:Uncharacterized protein n=1 Tax=Aspergillus caelatus TaxID=61420 RepID=A0A5N7A119_9EURO|nr:uncharacterized protein BDV27DRAFT_158743 [Aspergillus caelatus]KAE8363502.1 hypothetical protein BDV27DRAFT_158743 [Aspergillus caelatus]
MKKEASEKLMLADPALLDKFDKLLIDLSLSCRSQDFLDLRLSGSQLQNISTVSAKLPAAKLAKLYQLLLLAYIMDLPDIFAAISNKILLVYMGANAELSLMVNHPLIHRDIAGSRLEGAIELPYRQAKYNYKLRYDAGILSEHLDKLNT